MQLFQLVWVEISLPETSSADIICESLSFTLNIDLDDDRWTQASKQTAMSAWSRMSTCSSTSPTAPSSPASTVQRVWMTVVAR